MFKSFYSRTLRVDILTLFLTLILISTSVIVALFYIKQSKSIVEIARQTIDRAGSAVGEKVICLISDLEQMTQLSDYFLEHFETVSIENKPLVVFMAAALEAYPALESFFIATPSGDFLSICRLPPDSPHQALFRFHEVLPAGQSLYYKDQHLQTVAKEKGAIDFDPRKRPWFQEVLKAKQLHWSEPYRYENQHEVGITVAIPLFNGSSEVKAVIGADLPLKTLANFLAQQKIGKTGRAYIVDDRGTVLVPSSSDPQITQALQTYRQSGQNDFLFEIRGESYLANIHALPLSFERHWLIAVIAPLDDFFGNILKEHKETLLAALGILALAGLLVSFFSKRISKPIVTLAKEIDRIKHLDLESEKRVHSHVKEIITLDQSIASMRVMLRSFGRYVPQDIVKQLLQREEELHLGGEKREIAVLVSDIENFTTIVESYPIDQLIPLISAYFDQLTHVIFEAQGTIDKFIGDSVMAFWGAPSDTTKHELRACVTALRCQAALATFNLERQRRGEPLFITRFGVHSGAAIAGNFGTATRMNYTIMGDMVNTAFRLQQVNKLYHTAIIISESVYSQVKEHFLVRPLDVVSMKGKKEKVKIYELVAKNQAEAEITPQAWQKELCTSFTQAYTLYEQGKIAEAGALFAALHAQYPDDLPTQIYLKRTSDQLSR